MAIEIHQVAVYAWTQGQYRNDLQQNEERDVGPHHTSD